MGFHMGLQEDSEGQPRDSGQEEGRKEGKGGFSAGLTGGNSAGIGKAMEGRADDREWLSDGDGLGRRDGRAGMGMILENPIAGRGATIGGPGIPIHHPACENGATGRKTPFAGIPACRENPGFRPGPRASPPMGLFRGEISLVAVEGPELRSGLGDRGSGVRSAKTTTGLASWLIPAP